MIDDLFDSKKVTIEKLRQFNLLHKESFFSRQEHELAFSNFIFHAIKIIIITLINALIKKILSTLDFISKKSDIIDEFDITSDSDTIDDFDITDDIIDEIIEDSDTIEDLDTTSDTQSITDDTTDDFDITSDTQSITDDTTGGLDMSDG
jgi:hypothetical protein